MMTFLAILFAFLLGIEYTSKFRKWWKWRHMYREDRKAHAEKLEAFRKEGFGRKEGDQ